MEKGFFRAAAYLIYSAIYIYQVLITVVINALKNSTYIRFVDDMAMVCNDMATARDLRETIELYLDKKLKMKLSARKSFFRDVSDSCKFLGYNIFPEKLFLLKDYIDSTNEKLDKILHGKSGLTDEQIKNKIRSIKGKLKNTCEVALRAKVDEVYRILRAGGNFSRSRSQNITTETQKAAVHLPLPQKTTGRIDDVAKSKYEKREVMEDHATQDAYNKSSKTPQINQIEQQIAAEIRNLNICNLTPWEAFLRVKKWQENLVGESQ
ncbi:hypothetical protein FACS189481_5830 [Clostridia bacterium]|nr:hypothetical protein FACS189481_5830 [Clostridia bacterium]